MKTEELKCPYCGSEVDWEEKGEMLFKFHKNNKDECDNYLTCCECDEDFHVCIQVKYYYSTYKTQSVKKIK